MEIKNDRRNSFNLIFLLLLSLCISSCEDYLGSSAKDKELAAKDAMISKINNSNFYYIELTNYIMDEIRGMTGLVSPTNPEFNDFGLKEEAKIRLSILREILDRYKERIPKKDYLDLKSKCKELNDRLLQSERRNESLTKDNRYLIRENSTLSETNKRLLSENRTLTNLNASLTQQNHLLQNKESTLNQKLGDLYQYCADKFLYIGDFKFHKLRKRDSEDLRQRLYNNAIIYYQEAEKYGVFSRHKISQAKDKIREIID